MLAATLNSEAPDPELFLPNSRIFMPLQTEWINSPR